MSNGVSAALESLVKKGVFATEEQAIQELLREYVLRQIAVLRRELGRFERKYGLRFERFSEYLHERSALLETNKLSPEQSQALGRAIMQEEDDWLDWKVTKELLESWLGLRQEVTI